MKFIPEMRHSRRTFLRMYGGVFLSTINAQALTFLSPGPVSQPNILFFFIDDMGWQDTSVLFHTKKTKLNYRYHTPNMECLADEGMKFTQAYACAVCSPSRVSLMTGMNAARHMVTNWTLRKDQQPDGRHPKVKSAPWNINGMSPTPEVERAVYAVTLPMLLKRAGYHTIHCGKAHFGAKGTPGEDPLNLGFDVNIAGHAAGGPGSYYGKYKFSAAWRNGDRIWDVPGLEQYHGQDINLTEALTREAIKEIDRAVSDCKPFYLYMSHYAIHAPWEKDERFYEKYKKAGLDELAATYASMIESQDKSLGDLLNCIKRNRIENNTIVVFMTDNGQPKQVPRNKPLSGHKLTPYEGGIRVPLIVKWPGVVQPKSVCDNQYVIIEDIFPTFLEIAGIKKYQQIGGKIDGVSFVPLLKQAGGYPNNRAIFWHYPNTYDQPPYSSVRKGDWKLIYHHATRRLELFNLRDDIGEQLNLSDTNRIKTRELAVILSNHLRETNAKMTIDLSTNSPVEYPDQILFQRSELLQGAKIPESDIAANLEWLGVAVEEPDYTIWGAAPIQDEKGRTHLFVARWPESNVDPAWRKSSQIAHYSADKPEGPFQFKKAILQGTGQKGDWDAYAPHNPEVKKFGNTYALLYIANSNYHQPPHPFNQSIGMVVSKSLYGPWKKVGKNGLILSSSKDPKHWTYGMQVVNPTIINFKGKFLLYFKSRSKKYRGSVYAVAISDKLEGPYSLPDQPLTNRDVTIEDGSVFLWDGKVCLLTTDNHGQVTGIRGGGALWVSSDGVSFNPKWTQVGYYRIPAYLKNYDPKKVRRIYGQDPKLERPKILMIQGRPAYLYAPSGWAVHGGNRTACYVLRINLPENASSLALKRD